MNHYAEDLRLIVHAESARKARAIFDRLVKLMMTDDPALWVVIESDASLPELLPDYHCSSCEPKTPP